MTVNIQKEYAAIQGEEIVEKAPTESDLRSELHRQGLNPGDYDIVALPKPHGTIFV